jgi:hypothetical protein
MRFVGRLRCYSSGWQTEFTSTHPDGSHFVAQRHEDATHVRYRFAIDLFNGKEAPTGLRDASVVLVRNDGKRFTSQPSDLASMQYDPSVSMWTRSDVYVINIPPRQFVRMEITGSSMELGRTPWLLRNGSGSSSRRGGRSVRSCGARPSARLSSKRSTLPTRENRLCA